ncbi:unnamed protein product, partial [Musa acuminata var. zebrina]
KPSRSKNQWRTGVRERAYRRRLLEALRSARASRIASGPRAVKERPTPLSPSPPAASPAGAAPSILLGRRGGKLFLKAGGRVRRRVGTG